MPAKCCIIGCKNSKWKVNKERKFRTYPEDKPLGFHTFPKNQELCQQWRYAIKICNNQTTFLQSPLVCSDHFKDEDVMNTNGKIALRPTAVPTVFPHSNFSDYEILHSDDKENVGPSTKKVKVDVEYLKSNAMSDSIFLPPLMLGGNAGYKTEPIEKMIVDDVIPATTDTIRSIDGGCYSIDTDNFDISCDRITSTPKRRIRYPGDIDEEVEMSPNTTKRSFRLCKNKIKMQAKKIYSLKQTMKRQKKQIETLKGLLKRLKTSYGLSLQAVQSIESTFEDDIIEQLKNGRRSKTYTDNVKSFALTLNFYSNAAYQYIRRTFGNHLPHSNTLRSWYKTVNGDPGISVEALTILKSMTDDKMSKDDTLFVTLMVDEMAIRKQLIWNPTKKNFIGYIDYGLNNEYNDSTEEASDALVFMVVPINSKGKLPISYYFTNTFSGEEKAEIVKNLLRVIDEAGAEVLSFTFDGASSNIAMVESLGANLNFCNLNPSFVNPYTNRRINIFLDACHMIKLVRNNWAAKEVFYDGDGNAIKWEYITKLVDLQTKKGLSLGTKLTRQHIEFHNNKMKVRFAVQVLSKRVADALTYCKDMDEFKGCEATIKFISTFNDVFDILNSKSFSDNWFKRPFHKTNHYNIVSKFSEAKKLISELELDVERKEKDKVFIVRKKIVNSGNGVCFVMSTHL